MSKCGNWATNGTTWRKGREAFFRQQTEQLHGPSGTACVTCSRFVGSWLGNTTHLLPNPYDAENPSVVRGQMLFQRQQRNVFGLPHGARVHQQGSGTHQQRSASVTATHDGNTPRCILHVGQRASYRRTPTACQVLNRSPMIAAASRTWRVVSPRCNFVGSSIDHPCSCIMPEPDHFVRCYAHRAIRH